MMTTNKVTVLGVGLDILEAKRYLKETEGQGEKVTS